MFLWLLMGQEAKPDYACSSAMELDRRGNRTSGGESSHSDKKRTALLKFFKATEGLAAVLEGVVCTPYPGLSKLKSPWVYYIQEIPSLPQT